MADVELLPPPEKSEIDRHLPTGVRVYGYTSEDMHAYARANVAHATAPLQAEVEALRAEVDLRDSVIATHAADTREYQKRISQAEARAERMAEALRGLKDLMLRQVKWEPCDCGCPQQRTPDGPHSVTWLRAAQQVDIAIGKAEAEDRG